MKRNMVIVACFMATTFVHSAQQKREYYDYDCHGTTIRLIKGSLRKVAYDMDVMVVGENQQRALEKSNIKDSSCVGLAKFGSNYIFESDSASDECATKEEVYSKVLLVSEPCSDKEVHAYCPKRHSIETESKKDLVRCYENVFAEMKSVEDPFTFYELVPIDDQTKEAYKFSVGFSSLGTPVDMSAKDAVSVAVDTVTKYLKNNPNEFGTVKFAIENNAEFDLYKKLLNKKFLK